MFKLNGETWNIIYTSTFHPKLIKRDGTLALGSCDYLTRNIYINENLSLYQTKKVLCHEVTHAAMFSYNVNLSEEQEELIADLIATYGQEIINITNKFFTKIKNRGNYY